jgi:hypothetical protein
MDDIQKTNISNALLKYCARYKTDKKGDIGINKAAASLKNVSSATISQMLNGKWALITDEMWRNVAAQIGYNAKGWKIAKTSVYNTMDSLLIDSKENQLVNAIIGYEGSGKTEFLKDFNNGKHNFLLKCAEYWNKKHFLIKLAREIGIDPAGMNVCEIMDEIITRIPTLDNPILCFDEIDKVSDPLLYFLITLYNDLEDYCSIIMTATPYFEKRILRGIDRNLKGFRELYSRMGKKFIHLPQITDEDVALVCMENGINDQRVIKAIIDDSAHDLRRVKKKVQAHKRSFNKKLNIA